MQPEAIVIGAGPAGLMAAERIAEAGIAVAVYERMPSPGRKFLMAGRGGLNLTHSEPLDRFLARYDARGGLLADAVRAFPPAALRAWCEGLGEPTFVGSSGRVFPRHFKASPLLRAWLGRLAALGVAIHTRHRWLGFAGPDGLRFETPDGELAVQRPAATVLALGGASWPRLGSDGSWTGALADAGIAVTPLAPSNVGLRIGWTEHFRERFAGSPLKRVAVSALGRTSRGEAIVTARGLEGGAIYALSSAVGAALAAGEAVDLTIDLRPDMTEPALAARLAQRRRGESLSTWLRRALALPPVAIALLRESAGRGLPEEPAALARLVKAVTLPVTGTEGLERAISTRGGVAFEALASDFGLAGRRGVFVAGEMLDFDAPTGGYLLQAAFASGAAAAWGAIAAVEGVRDQSIAKD